MTKLTCTLTVTVTSDALERWQPNQFHPEPALQAVRSEIESWLDGLVGDGVLISEYKLAIRENDPIDHVADAIREALEERA